jgi:nonspecific dipeptidase
MAYFKLSVKCAEQDLHSGNFGGTIHESMTDLIKLLSTLVDSSGKILVDGVMDDVSEVTPEEEALYDALDFDIEAFKEEARIQNVSNATLHPDKKSLLMARWRYPTLSIHGIEGAFSGIGAKTVIPSEVHGKFSLRLVPGQDPKRIQEVIETHLQKEFAKIKSPNQFNLSLIHGAKAWISDPKHDNYQAGAKAIEKIYGIQPDYTRSGGSIPITSFFQDATQMNVMLLPIGACDDMAHSQNEKINITNFVNGMKVMGSYLYEISQVKGPKPSSRRCDLLPISEIDMNAPGAFMMAFQCKCNI